MTTTTNEGTARDARAVLADTIEAVTHAAEDLGHRLNAWPAREGWTTSTACRRCGMGAEASIGFATLTPWGAGLATLQPCPFPTTEED